MNGSRSPRRHRLVAGALAAALACVGAVAITAAAPSSAIPHGGCYPVETYAITHVASVWLPTDLNSGLVVGPGAATLSAGRYWSVKESVPAWIPTWETGIILVKAKAIYGSRVAHYAGGRTTSTHRIAVPPRRVRRLQQYIQARKFTVQKFAATNSVTCARGRQIYSATIIAPLWSVGDDQLGYALTR